MITADAIWPQYSLASHSDVVIISSAWLQANFPGVYEYDHALELQAQNAGVVIVTDGPRPVLVVRENGASFGVEPYHIPNVIDTSGAGNMFKAGIIYGSLQEGWSLEHKVKFAYAAAGLSCQRDRGTDAPPPSMRSLNSWPPNLARLTPDGLRGLPGFNSGETSHPSPTLPRKGQSG